MKTKFFLSIAATALFCSNVFAQSNDGANSQPEKTTFILPNGKIMEINKLDSLKNAWGEDQVLFKHGAEDDAKGVIYLIKRTKEFNEQVSQNKKNLASILNKPAPLFELRDITGKTWSLKELRGKIVVLNFWFTSCAPCVQEMPELNKLVLDYKATDVVFIGLTYNTQEQVKAFLKRRDFNYIQLPDSGKVDALYKIASWPASIVIDKSGVVRSIMASSPTIREDLKAAIDALE